MKCKNCGTELIKLRSSKYQRAGIFHNAPTDCTNPEPIETDKILEMQLEAKQ